MTIVRTTKRAAAAAAAERPQRRRSSLKAASVPAPPRPGRRAPAAAAAGAPQPSNVRVVVRVRPENAREREGNYKLVVRPLDDHMLIFDPRQQDEDFYFQGVRQRQRDLNKRASKDMQYMFDRVFHPHHTNQQLFEATTKDVVDTVIDGFNCSVFAYGSTGAGKTHTMLGTASEPGIIFLTVMELYSRIEAMGDTKCQVAVSYVEVYNETVTDLLTPSGPLDMREDGQRAVVIAGLSQSVPAGPDHLMTILEAGNRNRTQHPTDMNAESSRSHAVFQVVLRQSDSTASLSTAVRVSKLSLIDLAGSERGSATGHKGARFREGANINRSLLALGSCINALADGKKFVPYRDSKLTRLLKDSIGGNCKTVMIANVTPSSASFEDTHNTLKYADRAKAIKSRLQRNVVSVDMHVAQYARVVDELRLEVADLKAQLAERPAPAEPAAPAAPPPLDAAALRRAEAARRGALTRQLQLEAEAHQLRLRLHRRRLCCQRAALLRPGGGGGGRADRQQERLAGRLTAAHARLEAARAELAAAAQTAAEEAAAVAAAPGGEEIIAQLATERHLDECRVHAAHLEAVSRLQQLELASSDQLLGQLVAALREQYRVLGYMNFITPELEAQFKEIVGLVEGQKEVCWADQQLPPADSPGQPSYDVTALLRLADTSYERAEPARHAISLLRPSAPPAAEPAGSGSKARFVLEPPTVGKPDHVLPDSLPKIKTELSPGAYARAGSRTAADAEGDTAPASPPRPAACPALDETALDGTVVTLESVLPPGETTLGCVETDEALIDPAAAAALPPTGATPPRPRSVPHCRSPPPASPAFFDAEQHTPGPTDAESSVAESVAASKADSVAVSEAEKAEREPAEKAGAGRETGSPGVVQRDRDASELEVRPDSAPVLPVTAERPMASPAATESGNTLARDAEKKSFGRHLSPNEQNPSGIRKASPPGQTSMARKASPTGQLGITQKISPTGKPGITRKASPSGQSASIGRKASPSATSHDKGGAAGGSRAPAALNSTVTLPASGRRQASPDLNATVTLSVPPSAAPADLNATRVLSSPGLDPAGVGEPSPGRGAADAEGAAPAELNVTRTVPAAAERSPAAGGLNTTLTLTPPLGLNATQTLPSAGRLGSPSCGGLSPVPAAPCTPAALPSFERSPIGPAPGAAPALLELPPTPEILRRRTPLKPRAAAALPAAPAAAGLDATFTMAAPFLEAAAADGGAAPGAGGGARAVASRPAVKGSAAMPPPPAAGRPAKRPGSAGQKPAEARLNISASNSATKLSLSAQKSRSTSRLHSAPGSAGRDENKPRRDITERPGWGRTTTSSLSSAVGSADKASGRQGLISSVGKFGLGRNRTGGAMSKSRSTSVLKPFNC